MQTKYHMKKKRTQAEKKSPSIQGILFVHPRGFGFVNRPSPQDDIFISKSSINGAIDGDTVAVELLPKAAHNKGSEGKITKILKRGRTSVVGTIISHSKKSCIAYVPLLKNDPFASVLLQKSNACKIGDRVILSVEKWGNKNQKTSCRLSQVIGSCDNPADDIPYVIHEMELRDHFPENVSKEAASVAKRISKKEISQRKDLRDLECITIDPDTAKDFDDALSVEKKGHNFHVGVHIADVSHYVKSGSVLDKEAYLRCNSTYFPNFCIPMLPRELSENMCSLKPGVCRLAVSVFFTITPEGEILDKEIFRSVIKSKKRFTYSEAKQVLDGDKKSIHAPLLHNLVHVCNLLKIDRKRRGSVELFVPELVLQIDKKGNPIGVHTVPYDITHQMVEECMLKANEIVATELKNQGKQVSYRIHEEPSSDSLKEFATLVHSYGLSLPETPSPHDLQRFFQENEESSHLPYLAISYIKSNRLAMYSSENIGHYGLGLKNYCHFTSPIRRYIDLIIHRLLFESDLKKEEIQPICEKASEHERISAKAEGSVLRIKKIRYLKSLMQKSSKKTFLAIVTKVRPYGIVFDVKELMLEGSIHVSCLGDEYFTFHPKGTVFVGRETGQIYGVGTHIQVCPSKIDILLQEVSWDLVHL